MLMSTQEFGDSEQHSVITGQGLSPTGHVERLVAKVQGYFTDFLNTSLKSLLIKIKRTKVRKLSSFPNVQSNVGKTHVKYTYLKQEL